jgi:hypothetical protein
MILTILITFAAFILGVLIMGVVASGSSDDAYRRGRLDERAHALADALWHADHDSYGGSE